MVGLATLKRDRVSDRFRGALWQSARGGRAGRGRPCPHCDRPMDLVRMPPGAGDLELDVCRRCLCVWFDPTEYEALPHRPPPPRPAEPELSPRAREAVAVMRLDAEKRRQEAGGAGQGPAEAWKFLPAIFGLPVEVDTPPLAARPLATWGLAALLVVAFLVALADPVGTVGKLGFIPAQWDRLGGLTLLSSFFLHGGWLHLLGNLYFLLIFGDNVEDRLGKARFLLLVLGSHLAGMALHGALEPRGDVPTIGASAGIFGLVACYAITFPRAKLAFFLRLAWLRVPAWGMLAFYLLLQLVGAWAQVKGYGQVSNLGHLGGIVVGVLGALIWRMHCDDVRRPRYEAGGRITRL
jgi:membrane associated rhomboid family serine protease